MKLNNNEECMSEELFKTHSIDELIDRYSSLLILLENRLSKARYQHCKRVSKLAFDLSSRFVVNIEHAWLAAISHDCCRESSVEELLELAQKSTDNNILGEIALFYLQNIDSDNNRMLLHGLAATTYLQVHYPLDKDVYLAIASHTTGGPYPTDLQKVLYIADKLEIGRTFWKEKERLDILTQDNLDVILYKVITSIEAKFQNLHMLTIAMRETLIKEV